MRILVTDTDKPARSVELYLTRAEATELLGYVEELIASSDGGAHAHLNDIEMKREIMLALYDPSDLSGFSGRARSLLEGDE